MVFTIENISTSTAPMTRLEAEEITEAIQGNFNSLGNMLETARNRKAWKVLGYRDFEGYCNNEFGKSRRRAYELIAEAAIAQSLKEADPSLRLPAQSSLKLLKELPIEQQLEAVKRSEWLAKESDKKKPDRSDLLIAIDEMSGARSGDMRASLEARGFIKGVEVATTRGINIGSRGIITKVDKQGEIHVELHAGGKIPLDAASCRILSASEKPEKRAWYGTTDIGDRVLIFSKGLEGTLGTIKIRLTSEKMVGVEVSGQVLKLPYAELEVVEVEIDEPEQDSWLQNFIWTDFGVQWCYDSESEAITTVYQDLKLHTTEKGKGSPADWVRRWVRNNALNLAVELLPEEQLSSVITTRLITCGGEEEKGNLAESLIAEIWKMSLPSECREKVKTLIAGKAGKARGISFALTLPELLNGKKTQTRRAWQDDYARSFIRYFEDGIEIPALHKGQHRGGQEVGKIYLTEKPYQQMLSEMSSSDLEKEGGMCTTVQEFIDRFFEGQDKLVWVVEFEFVASDSASEVMLLKQRLEEAEQVISQLVKYQQSVADVDTVDTGIVDTGIVDTVDTVDTRIVGIVDTAIVGTAIVDTVDTVDTGIVGIVDTAIVGTAIVGTVDTAIVDTAEKLQQEIDIWRAKITDQLQQASYDVATTNQNMTSGLRARKRKTHLEDRLSEIDTLQNLRIGQIVSERDWAGVSKTCPGGWGEILTLGFIYDGIPQAWVKWNGIELPDRHPIRTLRTLGNKVMTSPPLDAPETSSLSVKNTAKISAPRDTAAHTDFSVKNTAKIPTPRDTAAQTDFLLDTELKTKIAQQRKKLKDEIANDTKKLADATRGEVKEMLNNQIDRSYSSLLDLEAFEKIEDGQTVEKKIRPGVHGNVTKIDFSRGGLPQVWVKWAEDKRPESINVSAINFAPVCSLPSSELPTKLQKDIKSARENIVAWREHAEEELATGEEHNKSIFARKIEAHNNSLAMLDDFTNLRIGQYVLDKSKNRRGKVLTMAVSNTGSPDLRIEWENGKTEPMLFTNIVPEQLNEH